MYEKILLIDDEEVIRSVGTEILTSVGYIVETACCAEDGFQLLLKKSYDLVITDIKMPGLSGIDLIKMIREEISSELPIIVITGHGTIDTAIKTMRHGTQGFVLKPFTPNEICGSVKQVITKSRIIRENIKLKALIPLLEVSKRMIAEIHVSRLLEMVVEEAAKYTAADSASLMMLDSEGVLSVKTARGGELVDKEDPYSGSYRLADWVVKNSLPFLLDGHSMADVPFERSSFNEQISSVMCIPIVLKDECIGVLNLYYLSTNRKFSDSDLELTTVLCGQAAIAIENARLHERTESQFFSMISTLASAIEARDRYTADHAARLARCAVLIAEEMGVEDDYLRSIATAGLLHDIGKIGIPDHILLKQGKLTVDEYEVIKDHPEIGVNILAKMGGMERVKVIVKHHHEHYSGEGYPTGLAGEEIPLGARIIAVADAFEAMTSERPYRQPMPLDRALKEIKNSAGTQFDPDVVNAFIRVFCRHGIDCMSEVSLYGRFNIQF
ncbi:MAG: response regulator [Candidatus Polarisedimenticolaceae bacterium]|nr:response regulator [Candidatus Polarisedimenticolaceae bacterium]